MRLTDLEADQDTNLLYPVFFKMDKLRLLVVGAGEVGDEKLHFLLKSSPNARITIVAPWANEDVQKIIANERYDITMKTKEFEPHDVLEHDLVIAATNIPEVNLAVYQAAKLNGKIVNVADTPELCDFYMGSIITRGTLKVAVSTNGKSPTFAKRFRQLLEDVLPLETNDLINNLKVIRDRLKGDFEYKVKELNKVTASLVNQNQDYHEVSP